MCAASCHLGVSHHGHRQRHQLCPRGFPPWPLLEAERRASVRIWDYDGSQPNGMALPPTMTMGFPAKVTVGVLKGLATAEWDGIAANYDNGVSRQSHRWGLEGTCNKEKRGHLEGNQTVAYPSACT
jgi:hypothetical protein